jgi:hypothetical protein
MVLFSKEHICEDYWQNKVDVESKFAKGQWCNLRDVPRWLNIQKNIWFFKIIMNFRIYIFF